MKQLIGLLLLGGIGYFVFQSSKIEPEKETVAAASPTPAVSATPKPKAKPTAVPKEAKAKETPKSKLGGTLLDMKPKKSK